MKSKIQNNIESDAEFPWKGKSIFEIFQHTANNFKENVFLQNIDDSITYGVLLEKVNKVADVLHAMQLDVERPIAVHLPSGSNWAIAVLAILKAGYFYVPIDPDFPKERNGFILQHSNASVVIGESVIRVDGVFIDAISIDSLLKTKQVAHFSEKFVFDSNSKASILYTSGSTGTPKGVIQTHQSVLHGIWRRSFLQNISPQDRITWLYSPSVKGSEFCFFCYLIEWCFFVCSTNYGSF